MIYKVNWYYMLNTIEFNIQNLETYRVLTLAIRNNIKVVIVALVLFIYIIMIQVKAKRNLEKNNSAFENLVNTLKLEKEKYCNSIDQQKLEMQKLVEKTQQDPLTSLYNKVWTRTLVQKSLENSSGNTISALMIIDIDDFKVINDTFGHYFGDIAICEVTSKIKKLFYNSDIIGRIGGDEFLIFVHDIKNEELVMKKAESICEDFRTIYIGENREHRVSASIGIAINPKDGTGYDELFKKADKALYKAKSNGKDQFWFYLD